MATVFPIVAFLMVSGYCLGILAALFIPGATASRIFATLGATLGALAAFSLGAAATAIGSPATMVIRELLPLPGIALRLDGLSALFLMMLGLIGIAAAIYGFSYSASYTGRYSLRLLGAMFNILLLSLCIQVLADNALTFLIAWEAMSLSAYWLVLTEHDQPGTVRAGIWYLAMTHAGFIALIGMFLLLADGELTISFAAMRAGSTLLAAPIRDAVFLLALVGFGTKAGIIPLHIWLPMAHPVAPSHVSALMSGVVIKMGIYGLVRVVVDLLGGGPVWWGGVVLSIGTISALLGVLYALMEHDLKQLLAYHSVENIGIILIGIGAGLIFQSYDLTALAAVGFVGGLYHTINHAMFKGLLFLSAGSVLHATHTRNMEELGGLIKRMPWTSGFFLIGAVAIAALPPLNGFVSEWLVFQALLGGTAVPTPEIAALMPIAVGMLALTSGLAAACFVKAFGITFLALPRSVEAEHAHESPRPMLLGMGMLALACIGLGLAPFAVVPMLGRALGGLGGLPVSPTPMTFSLALPTSVGMSSISSPLLGLGLLIVLGFVVLVLRILRVNRTLRVSDSWGCGRVGQTPRMEYTATAFAEPLRRVFAELYRPTKELTIDVHPDSQYFVQSITYHSAITPWFEQTLYAPLLRFLRATAYQIRRLQSGSLHLYLSYVAITLVLLLIVARWF